MEKKNIILVVNSDVTQDLYQASIDEYNQSQTYVQYTISHHVKTAQEVKKDGLLNKEDIIFVDFSLADGNGLDLIGSLLPTSPQLQVLVLCEPKDLKHTSIIREWDEAYPLAVIGLVIKPIQPSAIWGFLESCERAMPLFDWDVEGEWGDWDGME